jgi:hypothetical protein
VRSALVGCPPGVYEDPDNVITRALADLRSAPPATNGAEQLAAST